MFTQYYNAGKRGTGNALSIPNQNESEVRMAKSELPHKEIFINHKGGIVTVLVDAEDYPLLNRHSWYIRSTTYPNPPYPATTLHTGEGKQQKRNLKVVPMHQIIMGVGYIDHHNGNTLDNRKNNLRKATRQQNNWNQGKPRRSRGRACTSKYKGVRYVPKNGVPRWQAYFKHVETGAHKSTGKVIYLGYFWNEEDAARAYNKAIVKHRGEFAWLNPVSESKDAKK